MDEIMSPWVLLVFLLVVWILWVVAASGQAAVSDARRGISEGERSGVSIFPALPFLPLMFWGTALFVDRFVSPWGTLVVGGIHLVLGIVWGISTFRDSRDLAKIDAERPDTFASN